MIFKQGYPGVISGEYGYFQAVQEVGFMQAHYQMLVELREWFENQPAFARSPYAGAQEAYRIHEKFIELLFREHRDLPVVWNMQAQFIQVFGTSGRAVIAGVGPHLGPCLENRDSRQGRKMFYRPQSKSEILRTIRSS